MKSILRGRILSFLTEPQTAEDTGAFTYLEDGALIMEGGKILHLGDFAALAPDQRQGAQVIDHRPNLIMPGFIDTHLHFPQMHAVGSWGKQLLD